MYCVKWKMTVLFLPYRFNIVIYIYNISKDYSIFCIDIYIYIIYYYIHIFSTKQYNNILILVYYVFPQLVKRVLIHSLIYLLCMLLQHCGMTLI